MHNVLEELDRLVEDYNRIADEANGIQNRFFQIASKTIVNLQKQRDSQILDGLEQSHQIRQLTDRVNSLGLKLANRNARIAELERFAGLDRIDDSGEFLQPEIIKDAPPISIASTPPDQVSAEVVKTTSPTRQKKTHRKGKKKQGRGHRMPDSQALEMRQMYESGVATIAEIGRAYQVTYSAAYRVCKGETYKDLGHE